MNLLKKGSYILLLLVLAITISCEENEEFKTAPITGLDFVVATLNADGTKVGVVPSTAFGNGNTVYSVDFGATEDSDTDVLETSGPMVSYTYPKETMTYTVTVTASLEGVSDVSVSKEHTVTYTVAPPPTNDDGPLVGTWKFAPEAAAMGVGEEKEKINWWSNSTEDVTTRACLFDDEYVFNADGTFQNVLGDETWLEGWQGASPDGCGAGVAPHDGTAEATYVYDETAGTITINGKGAFLGLPKAINGAELGSPTDAPDSITYIAVLDEKNGVLDLDIEVASGGFWTFKLIKVQPPIVGRWKFAPEAAAMGVGEEKEKINWWSNSTEDITTRACLFDDEYVFYGDGSFENVLGDDTWLEGWQGASADGCGAGVAPHDGTAEATYVYDETAGTIKIEGKGAFLGLAKAINGAELGSPTDAPDSITYIAVLDEENGVLDLDIEVANGGFWSFKLVKQ